MSWNEMCNRKQKSDREPVKEELIIAMLQEQD